MNTGFRQLKEKRERKKALPVSCTCRNCGTQQISRYCHNCGQDLFSGSERSLKEIIGNTLDTVFAFDNKILLTLKYLLFYPGKLTKEYFAGRIMSYVFPSKLFWFMSLIFFATLSGVDTKLDDKDFDSIIITVKEELSKAGQEDDNIKVAREKIKNKLEWKIREKNLVQTFFSYLPYATFLLVPFFALMLQMFYFRKCRYYASHMVFALHFHSFVFFLLTLINALEFAFPAIEEDDSYVWLARFFIPVIYFIIALYVVYRPKKRNLLWKVPVIMLVYAIAMLVAIVILAIIVGFIEAGPEIIDKIFGGEG